MRESINTERPLRDMQSRLGFDITPHENRTHTIWSLRRWVSAAAILLLVIGVGYQSYKYGIGQINKTSDKEIALSSPITHGQTKAVLTLNNGEPIETDADTKRNEQIIKNKENETVYNIAEITAVATDLNGKLIRHMPEDLRAAFEKAM